MKHTIVFLLVFIEISMLEFPVEAFTHGLHRRVNTDRILNGEPMPFYPVPPNNIGAFNHNIDPMQQMISVVKGNFFPGPGSNPPLGISYPPQTNWNHYMPYKNNMGGSQSFIRPPPAIMTELMDYYKRFVDGQVTNKPSTSLPNGVDPFVDVFANRKNRKTDS